MVAYEKTKLHVGELTNGTRLGNFGVKEQDTPHSSMGRVSSHAVK